MRKTLLVLMLSAALGGCAVGPRFYTPQLQVPTQFRQAPSRSELAQPLESRTWWTTFHDPLLEALIDRAVRSNRDLRIAEARVREAREARGVAGSARWPSVSQSASASRLRGGFSQGLNRVGAAPGAASSRASLLSAVDTNVFQVGFDASWELDVFGGVRRSVEAADADLRAAEESRRDTLITLVAEVARNYIEVRGLQKQREIAKKNIETQQQTRELTAVRYRAGLATGLDVAQASAQLATTQAAVPSLEAGIMQGIHRLGVLLGHEPETWPAELETVAPMPMPPPTIPAGLPSDLLRRRPDIRRAEAELAAATARVGVARSDLFPKFLLTGLAGRQSTELSSFSLGVGNFFSIGPSLRLPLFTGGRIRSNIAVQDARREQTLARFESTVLTALEDVENALVAYARQQERRARLNEAVEASQLGVDLAKERYVRGLSDFLSVLDAERSLYATEDQLVQSEMAMRIHVVSLYKALGGGWEDFISGTPPKQP